MSKDYNAIDGIIKQTRECVTDAFNKGYKQGRDDIDVDYEIKCNIFKKGYDEGLEDAWECAISIFKSLWSDDEVFEWFKLSASEAIQKWKEQETKQENTDWHDLPSDEMTLEQAREAVTELRKTLAVQVIKQRK